MDDVGVYVHVPFCERVCPYCDFPVLAARPLTGPDQDRYVDALLAELEARRPAFEGAELATLYFGGGTPSLLEPDALARVMGAVRAAFPGEPRELTLEVNPSTTERERLAGFRDAGVDRVSLGIQSFDDTTLRRLGRAHRAVECERTLEACRRVGFERLSLDLIVAAPGQGEPDVERDLDAALAAGPDHLSVYELSLESGTPFAAAAERGGLDLPSEQTATRILERVPERLEAAGYRHYEISSYARPGAEAVHNRRYWNRLPVLGLGMGAVSNDPARPGAPHGVRRRNPTQLAGYYAAVGSTASVEEEVLSPATARGEAVFLALRTDTGLDPEGFVREFGHPPRHFFAAAIDAQGAAGLLDEGPDGSLRLTARGRMLSDSVFAAFV